MRGEHENLERMKGNKGEWVRGNREGNFLPPASCFGCLSVNMSRRLIVKAGTVHKKENSVCSRGKNTS